MNEIDYQQLEILNKHLLDTNKDLGKEIKRLKEDYMILQNASDEVEEEKDREIERLHSIIKEVREYIGIDENIKKSCDIYDVNGIDILEILDKEKE